MPNKIAPCKCGAWPFPHHHDWHCASLVAENAEAQRDYEQEIAADNRERAADIRAELNRGKR